MKTALTYGPLAIGLLTMFTFVRPAGMGVRPQAIWAMVLLACFAKFVVFQAFGGSAFNPEFPEIVLWTWNWAYSGAMILFALSLIGWWMPRRPRIWLLPLVAWSLAAWGLWNGLKPPALHEVECRFSDLPPSLEGYRIAHVTDVHVSSAARRSRTEGVVRVANAANADLVCLTGDLVDGQPEERARDLEPIRGLTARDGVWACSGNHESYYSLDVWAPYYAKWKIPYLRNSCVFPRPGLALGGVDDMTVAEKCLCGRVPDLKETFAAATNGEFRVLLQHRPEWADENAADADVRLQLSGHTHGGIAPVLEWLVGLANRGFVRGLYPTAKGWTYVSRGAGQWAGFPMRFFNDPEVTVFTLRRK